MDIKNLIGETTDYDKKLKLEEKKAKSWCKSVSAFANSFGGALIFGVDNDDKIVGLEDAEGDSEKISEFIKNRIRPIPQFKLRFEMIDDKKLIVLDILPGEETPYYYAADGVMEAYTRIGNESVVADDTEHKRLVLRGKQTSFDSQRSGYKLRDYSFSLLKSRYNKVTGKSFDDNNYESFGISDKDGNLTNAGALIADDSPIKCSRVLCRRWNGLTKAGGIFDAIDSNELEGGLIQLLNDGAAFIRSNMRVMWRKLSNSREDYPDYQERAYFEALVNALIHRDYLIIGSEVHIDIFDDRLEIVSPGGMFYGKPIQEQDINNIASMRRNPVIADIFSRLGYMERSGSGLSKICEEQMHSANFLPEKMPTFYSDRTQFRLIMPNLNYKNEKIQQLLSEDGVGQVAGQVTGGIAGQVTGQIAGQVTDLVTEQIIGQVKGQITGKVNGQVTDEDMGQITGQVTGQVTDLLTEKIIGVVSGQMICQITCQCTGQAIDLDMNQVIGKVTLKELIDYCKVPRTRIELQNFCKLSSQAYFRKRYLKPLLDKKLLKMTIPDTPNSSNQRYYSYKSLDI